MEVALEKAESVKSLVLFLLGRTAGGVHVRRAELLHFAAAVAFSSACGRVPICDMLELTKLYRVFGAESKSLGDWE